MAFRSSIHAGTVALLVSCNVGSNVGSNAGAAVSSVNRKPPSTPSVDRESTQQKLERLVATPGRERSQLDWLMSLRAYQSLLALGRPGFDDFVERRIARARHERAEGRRLTIDR